MIPSRFNLEGVTQCHYLATIASIAAIVSAAASAAGAAYSATQTPGVPNTRSSSRKVAQAQANALPQQRKQAAIEQTGGKLPQHITKHTNTQKVQMVQVPTGGGTNRKNEVGEGGGDFLSMTGALGTKGKYKWVPYNADDWKAGGKYNLKGTADKKPHTEWHNQKTVIPEHDESMDFTGLGTADIMGELTRQEAQLQEDLGKKYGVRFAEEARKEQELADPLGTQARAKENELIQQLITNPPPVSPLSGQIDTQVADRLKAGSGFDPMTQALLEKEVAAANASRGGGASAADVAGSLSSGMEGAARNQAAMSGAQNWLASGSTPEDIRLRREQQNLGNLGAFVGGQTPQSQFASLSGASRGATPTVPGQQLPTMPNNAGPLGNQYGMAAWNAQNNQQLGQANPWMASLSALLSGIGSYAQAR